jgi:two-component system nitrate/nitrite response regulator NarL
MRLLLCDGHQVFAESLALALDEAGYQIAAVTHSPDEALVALRRGPADLCVIDVGCAPDAVLARLAALRAAAPAMAVVLMSGSRDTALIAEAARHGVHGFAFKDRHLADIVEVIDRAAASASMNGRARPRDAGERRPAADLTAREQQVLSWLVRGKDTGGVATSMGVTQATARSHIQSVLKKLGSHSRVEASAKAVRDGLVDAETGEWLPRR